jgi:hypothetical protein
MKHAEFNLLPVAASSLLVFNPEDGGKIFLQNVTGSLSYMALLPRVPHSS